MKQNNFGEIVYSEEDLVGLVMTGQDVTTYKELTVDDTVNLETLAMHLQDHQNLLTWKKPTESTQSAETFHRNNQLNWHMPDDYKKFDIAAYVLSLCTNEAELQRAATELLLYQERNLFDLLRYLKYLVDIMNENQIIWGVGRGSSVSSYVLYLLKVHRIDSLYYDLDINEFLR